jgi:hypothetical protein
MARRNGRTKLSDTHDSKAWDGQASRSYSDHSLLALPDRMHALGRRHKELDCHSTAAEVGGVGIHKLQAGWVNIHKLQAVAAGSSSTEGIPSLGVCGA